MNPLIRTITFQDEGLVIEYCHPGQDARSNGVVLNHAMLIPHGSDYDEEIDTLTEAAAALLLDVLEDLPVLQPLLRAGDEDDDEDDDDD
jgi:hypothetical protein